MLTYSILITWQHKLEEISHWHFTRLCKYKSKKFQAETEPFDSKTQSSALLEMSTIILQ